MKNNNNQTVDKLAKYEKKMAKYRNNLRRRAYHRALEDSQWVTEEIEVKLPYEIRKTKPNASKGVKTDCVFKWSKIALEAKKALHNMKERVFKIYEKDGKTIARESYRHPKLYELTFETKEPITKTYTKEELHELHLKHKEEKQKKYEELEFGEFHHTLVAEAYSSENQRLKQAANKAAHETKIQKLMEELRKRKLARYKYRLEFRKLKGTEPFVFIKNHSNKPLSYLSDVMDRLAVKLVKKIEDFTSINIYDNKTDKLLKLSTGWRADDIAYKNKLDNMKALYPEYYNAA